MSAVIVLVIMVVPIVSSVSRELFTRVPRDIQDGSLALGATRWETIRQSRHPVCRAGLLAASVLGLGRAIGEAIAVTQVIGVTTHGLSLNFFNTGDTLASRIAGQFQGAASNLQIASLFYLALILLVLSLIFNLVALGDHSPRRAGPPMSVWDGSRRSRARASEATTGGRAAVGASTS